MRSILALSGTILCLLLFVRPAPAAVGCLCKNYEKEAFCVQHIGACQSRAGNCMGTCVYTPAREKKFDTETRKR